jgi:hypothetical protein
MLHEVRIFDKEGKLKKVISRDHASRIYWKKFDTEENQIGLLSTGRSPVSRAVKQQLDLEFFAVTDSTCAH